MIDDYKKFMNRKACEHDLMMDVFDIETIESLKNSDFDFSYKHSYDILYFNYLLALDVFDININEKSINNSEILDKINNNYFEEQNKNLAKQFYNSVQKSKYLEYLSPYTETDYKNMKLFKLKGLDIGFALDGNDIVAVHNNGNVKGIGFSLMKAAIKNGGKTLDHFDGGLTKFYEQIGFVENKKNRLLWDEKYAPEKWKYKSINIFNPEHSVYADELPRNKDDYTDIQKIAFENYQNGKPSIIFRSINKSPLKRF